MKQIWLVVIIASLGGVAFSFGMPLLAEDTGTKRSTVIGFYHYLEGIAIGGVGSQTYTLTLGDLPSDYKVILTKVYFNDDGILEINDQVVVAEPMDNPLYSCTAGDIVTNKDITKYLHPGANTIKLTARECHGGGVPYNTGLTAKAYIDIYSCGSGNIYVPWESACYRALQSCQDNNLDGDCDLNEPVIYCVDNDGSGDCSPSDYIYSDSNGDRVADDIRSLFCLDNNDNNICDQDELEFWLAHCMDVNSNGVCDDREAEGTFCSLSTNYVCGMDGLTYRNNCFMDSFTTQNHTGKCTIVPIIIRKDCNDPDEECTSGYTCSPDTGWCIRTDTIYTNVDRDCRFFGCDDTERCVEGSINGNYVCKRTEFVNITCVVTGCPNPITQTCIGGVCQEFILGQCPNDITCADYTGTNGQPLVCDEQLGLCVDNRYFHYDCRDDDIGCNPDENCTQRGSGYTCVKIEEPVEPKPNYLGYIFGFTTLIGILGYMKSK